MNRIFGALALLVRNPLYLISALVLALLLFALYFLVNDFDLFRSAFAISSRLSFIWKVFSNQVSMVAQINGIVNVAAVGTVAALGGINLSLTALRVRRTKVFVGRAGLAGIFGTFGGAFAASCSACSTALISVLGVTGGLAVFPFGGLEISILAIGVLLASLYYIAKSLGEFGIIGNA